MSEYLKLASIDAGTNSTRMLVARCNGERTETLDRRMVITRLGEGVDRTGKLSRAAIERALRALEEYRDALDGHMPNGIRVAATSALRDCENADEFLRSAGKIMGREPEVLSGEDEARMSFLGAVSGLDEEALPEGRVLVFDIGGGSTEIMVGDAPLAPGGIGGLSTRSLNVGCVRMSERFIKTDPPSPVTVGRMESHLVTVLKPVMDVLLHGKPSLGIGLAGTVTTLSAIRQGLTEYRTELIHHSRLTRGEVEELFVELASVDVKKRKKVMGLEPGRADVIVGGTAVLRAVMDLAGLDEILVSEKDILDGLVLELYDELARDRTGDRP